MPSQVRQLAFLQQMLDVIMNEVSAVQICASNFIQGDIEKAKQLLFESQDKVDQMLIQDIITLLKETDPVAA